MKKNNRETGTGYEKTAGKYLEESGYQILEYNFRCRTGEIDIIAKDGEYLVFCEVKYRRTDEKGHPLEAVSVPKQRKISRCAAVYTAQKKLYDMPCRFDVVGILGEEMILVRNAFDFVE